MDKFSPEFTAYWMAESAQAASRPFEGTADEGTLTTSQQVALEELAERVCAARRIA